MMAEGTEKPTHPDVDLPAFWVERLAKAKLPATTTLARIIWRRWQRYPGRPLEIPNKEVASLMSSFIKATGLLELEAFGLIVMKRRPRQLNLIQWVLTEPLGPDEPAWESVKKLRRSRKTGHGAAAADTQASISPGTAPWRAWRAYLGSIGRHEIVERMNRAEAAGKAMKVPAKWPPSEWQQSACR
jgi:hypothetical protein